ncbi:MAG: hypothetical protein WD009_05550 [Phycisphaeraceae bacterium]
MNRYQLAKLIDWAGGKLETRKRLQKVTYLLKAAGCPLDAEFTLHHYGPYSHDVAELVDEMVAAKLLKEEAVRNEVVGHSYHYELPEHTQEQLHGMDGSPRGAELAGGLGDYEQLARDLFQRTVPRLELASTVAYFHRQGKGWEEAREAAARFKSQEPNGAPMREAEQLARKVVEEEAHA